MSFIDHLEELRWHIIRAVVAILIGAIIVFIYVREIVDKILLAPAHENFVTYKWLCDAGHFFRLGNSLCMGGTKVSFISTAMTGQFISSFTVAFVGGFIVAFPYVFWEFWRFVRPALNPKELKKTSVHEWLSNNSKKKLPTGQLLKRIIYLFALTTKFVPKPDSKIIVFGGRI